MSAPNFVDAQPVRAGAHVCLEALPHVCLEALPRWPEVAVYRVYMADGALLYVGMSDDPKRRFGQHAAAAEWYDLAHSVEWENFADRATAAAEEIRQIATLEPLWQQYVAERRQERVQRRRQEQATWAALLAGLRYQPTPTYPESEK